MVFVCYCPYELAFDSYVQLGFVREDTELEVHIGRKYLRMRHIMLQKILFVSRELLSKRIVKIPENL